MKNAYPLKTKYQIGLGLVAAVIILGCNAPVRAVQATPADGAMAVVEVAKPRVGNLLYLRGMAGRGTAYFMADGQCSKIPVRLVAGDFTGSGIRVNKGQAARLLIRSAPAVRGLMRGRELISDSVRVTDDHDRRPGDVVVLSGLSPTTGFVVNPGGSAFADIFPPRARPIDCAQVRAHLPSAD